MAELLQETYGRGDPWRVLVICILLNRTTGTTAEPTIKLLFETWPNAYALARAKPEILRLTIEGLGFGQKRTEHLRSMSYQWALLASTGRDMRAVDPRQFPGCGEYAWEAWQMFVLGRLDFLPHDRRLFSRMLELRKYHS